MSTSTCIESLGMSEREALCSDRDAVLRIANAADISMPSVREHIRNGSMPHNRHVAAVFRRTLAVEVARLVRRLDKAKA